MAKKKEKALGKKQDDIFSSKKPSTPIAPKVKEKPKVEVVEEPKAEVVETRGRGRPTKNEGDFSKVTIILEDQQIHWLDGVCSDIRLKKKAAISRAELVRALVGAAQQSGIDFSDLMSEEEIRKFLVEKLNK